MIHKIKSWAQATKWRWHLRSRVYTLPLWAETHRAVSYLLNGRWVFVNDEASVRLVTLLACFSTSRRGCQQFWRACPDKSQVPYSATILPSSTVYFRYWQYCKMNRVSTVHALWPTHLTFVLLTIILNSAIYGDSVCSFLSSLFLPQSPNISLHALFSTTFSRVFFQVYLVPRNGWSESPCVYEGYWSNKTSETLRANSGDNTHATEPIAWNIHIFQLGNIICIHKVLCGNTRIGFMSQGQLGLSI
jgi:hypothetical protein